MSFRHKNKIQYRKRASRNGWSYKRGFENYKNETYVLNGDTFWHRFKQIKAKWK